MLARIALVLCLDPIEGSGFVSTPTEVAGIGIGRVVAHDVGCHGLSVDFFHHLAVEIEHLYPFGERVARHDVGVGLLDGRSEQQGFVGRKPSLEIDSRFAQLGLFVRLNLH